MISIFFKEIRRFLSSLIAYIVIAVFLTSMGLLMWVFPDTSVLNYGFADMNTLFSLSPYVFMFLIPAITMRSFSEEIKTGTIELLYTKPVSDWEIILGKYLSSVFLVFFALLPTVIYYFSLYKLGNPQGNIDSAGVVGSYFGLFLLGAVFTSIGILASSITENQIIAFLIAVFLCFVLYSGFDAMSKMFIENSASVIIEQIGIIYHYNALSKGLIDTRNIIYFFSVIFFMLLLTQVILEKRKW